MFRKFISSLLIVALVNVLGIASAYAGANPEKERRLSSKAERCSYAAIQENTK